MSPHSIATSAIEAAIETMLLPGSGPVEDAKAETLVVAYFSLLAIDARDLVQLAVDVIALADDVLDHAFHRAASKSSDWQCGWWAAEHEIG